VVAHELAQIDFTSSLDLQRLAAGNVLSDLILSIYYVQGRRIAYLRGSLTAPMVNPAVIPCSDKLATPARKRSCVLIGTAVTTALAIAACSSHNKLVTPSGKNRVAVNSPDSLSHYQDLVARQDAIRLEKSEQERKLEALSRQVEALKEYIVTHDKVAPGALPAPTSEEPPPAPKRQPGPSHSGSGVAQAMQVLGPERVIFRVNHAVGHTEFIPPESIQADLLKAAKAAKRITIRGRTDATQPDDVETRIALGRAHHAKSYLVDNGVDASKIQVRFLASGGFIADDSTPAGRALNRRVEIETVGVDVASLSLETTHVQMGSNL
jgi:outer membrane protein OmpA-like peptidoglycan-associated protein